MRRILPFALVLIVSMGTTVACFAQDGGRQNTLLTYQTLLEAGIINRIEYNQLKKEYFKHHYDYSALQTWDPEKDKAKREVVTGSLMVPIGLALGAGGLARKNRTIPYGPEGEYEKWVRLNSRTSTGLMIAGGVTSLTGVVLITIGATRLKIVKSGKNVTYEAGALDGDLLGMKLTF